MIRTDEYCCFVRGKLSNDISHCSCYRTLYECSPFLLSALYCCSPTAKHYCKATPGCVPSLVAEFRSHTCDPLSLENASMRVSMSTVVLLEQQLDIIHGTSCKSSETCTCALQYTTNEQVRRKLGVNFKTK